MASLGAGEQRRYTNWLEGWISVKSVKSMNPELLNLKVEDSWTVYEGEYNGKPLIARVNIGLQPLVGDSRYQHRIGVAVPFNSAGEDGFPSGEESWKMSEIEDLLAAELERHHESLFAVVITTGGM